MTLFSRYTVPNGLSFLRLALGISFPFFPPRYRLGVVALALLTEYLDGLTARLLGATSRFGRMLDPIADKVFVFTVLGTLVAERAIAPWHAALLLTRDVTVILGCLWLAVSRQWERASSLPPSLLGKTATATQFGVLVFLLWLGGLPPYVFLIAGCVCLAAAVQYTAAFLSRP